MTATGHAARVSPDRTGRPWTFLPVFALLCVVTGIGVSTQPSLVGVGLAIVAFAVCAVVLLRSAAPTERTPQLIDELNEEAPARFFESQAFRLPLYLASFLLAVDGTGYWSSGKQRYLVVLLVLIPLCGLVPGRQTRRSPSWVFISAGWLTGLAGSLVAFAQGNENTWLQVFLPMTIVVVIGYLDLSGAQRPYLETAIHTIIVSSSILSIAGAVTWLIGLRQFSGLVFLRHEVAFVNISAIVLTWAARRRVLLFANLVALGVAFAAYPAATYPIVVVCIVLALLSYGQFPGRLWRWVGGTGLALLLIVGGRLILTASAITQSYAASVGKLDNSAFRRELWLTGLHDFSNSPIYGTLWTGPYNILDLNVPGVIEFSAPIHNEYIALLRSGGSIGFALIVLPLLAIFRPKGAALANARTDRRQAAALRLETAVKVCAVAFLVASFFNPLWAKTSTAIFGWLLVGLAFAGTRKAATA